VAAATHAYFDVIRERGAILVAALRGLPLEDEESANRRNPAFFVELFQAELGLSPAVARVVSAVYVTGIDGAVEHWVNGTVSRSVAEATFVAMVVNGAIAARRAEEAGTLS
jgi:hypothetical protein